MGFPDSIAPRGGPRRRGSGPLVGVLLAVATSGCDLGFGPRPAGTPGLAHTGFRSDVPDAQRGNAVFEEIWWSDDGSCIATRHHLAEGGLRIWDARTGALLGEVDAQPHDGLVWLDGARGRMLANSRSRRWLGDAGPITLFDLADGRVIARLEEDLESPPHPLGWLDGGASVLVSRPGVLEVWNLEPPELLRRGESPIDPRYYQLRAVLLPATYTKKRAWEISPSGRMLAVAHADPERNLLTRASLVDLETLAFETLDLPEPVRGTSLQGFAFSPDETVLAVGTGRGVVLRDLPERTWRPLLSVSGARNDYLGPMAFGANGARLVTLGDELRTSVFDVTSGALVGEHRPPFGQHEGVFRVSRDGSRVVIYHFTRDVLEVLDGRDARPLGWICPFFCNALHNPVRVNYAVAPDGTTVAASHRYGAGIFETDRDLLVAPLMDAALAPARPR